MPPASDSSSTASSSNSKNFYDHNHANDDDNEVDELIFDDTTRHERKRNGRYILSSAISFKYIWCRYEEDWVQGVSYRQSRGSDQDNNDSNHQRVAPFLRYKTCFEGDRYFVANENRISTVIYRCGTVRRDTGDIVATRLWKLYIDQFATVYQKRGMLLLSKI